MGRMGRMGRGRAIQQLEHAREGEARIAIAFQGGLDQGMQVWVCRRINAPGGLGGWRSPGWWSELQLWVWLHQCSIEAGLGVRIQRVRVFLARQITCHK